MSARERDAELMRQLRERHPEMLVDVGADDAAAFVVEIKRTRMLRFLFTGHQLTDAPFYQ